MSKGRFVAALIGLVCLLATPSTASAIEFGPWTSEPSSSDALLKANALVSADFNGDGRDDIAAGSMGNGIQIRLASASGWVGVAPLVPNSGGAYSLATGDFNKDGKADLAFTDYACGPPYANCPNDPSVILGNGDGSFGVPIDVNSNMNSPGGFDGMTVGDADSDGNMDLVIGSSQGEYGIAYGNGSGGFTLAQRTQIPGAPHGGNDDAISAAIGDFNGDGDNDLAFAIRNEDDIVSSGIHLLLGDGSRNFTPSGSNPIKPTQPAGFIDSIRSADFNNDGNDDLAATTSEEGWGLPSATNGTVRVWTGDDEVDMVANPMVKIPVGSPNPGDPNPTRVGPSNLRIGDFDTDGKLDLAWMEYVLPNGPPEYRLGVARNTGQTFYNNAGGPWNFPNASGSPIGLAIGDFNGDDAPDAAMSSWGNGIYGGLFTLENRVDLHVLPESLDFGSVLKGSSTASWAFQILNVSGPDVTVDQVTLSGPDAAKFGVPADCAGQLLDAIGACWQRVTFNPNNDFGTYTATAHVTFQGTSETFDIPLSATVDAPEASFDPGHLDFGQLRIGQSRTMTITATNTGGLALEFMDDGFIDGAAAGRFEILGDTCSGNLISPDGTCEVTIKATANATGPVTAAQMRLVNDGFESPQGVNLSFTGIDPGVDTVPSSYDFGPVEINDQELQFFNIESTGTTGLEITDLEVDSDYPGDFAIAGPGCLGTYAPNDECQFQVAFQPQPGGPTVRTGQIQFQTNASDDVTVIPIRGTATKAVAEPLFQSAYLGEVPIGKTSSELVTVKSAGTAPLEIEGVWVDGPNPEDNDNFSVANDDCSGESLTNGQSCTYEVVFAPDARRDYLAYTGIDANDSFDIRLEGDGLQPNAQADAESYDFGRATIGGGSPPSHSFTLNSSGLDPVSLDTASITGPDAGSFRITDAAACRKVLPVGQTCQLSVTFDPATGDPGTRTAVLAVPHETGTVEVALTGTAAAASAGQPKARVSVKSPKKVRVKKKTRIKVRVTVANTGSAAITGAKLTYSARQGKKGKAIVSRRVALPGIAPGKKIRKTITINLRATKLKRSKPAIKLNFGVVQQGRTVATGRGTTRLDFGQVKPDRR